MISLGLDPSLRSFGWCVVDTSATGRKRRIDSGHEATFSTDCPPARYLYLQEKIRDLLKKYHNVEVVGIESPAYQAGVFQSIHHSLMMFSMAEVFLARKDCVLFDPATREYLIRNGKKGKLGKIDVQKFVQFDTKDISIIQNDEADAYAIGLFAARLKELQKGVIIQEDLSPAEEQKFLLMTREKKTLGGTRIIKTAHSFRENNRFFEFSRVPPDSIILPKKTMNDQEKLNMILDRKKDVLILPTRSAVSSSVEAMLVNNEVNRKFPYFASWNTDENVFLTLSEAMYLFEAGCERGCHICYNRSGKYDNSRDSCIACNGTGRRLVGLLQARIGSNHRVLGSLKEQRRVLDYAEFANSGHIPNVKWQCLFCQKEWDSEPELVSAHSMSQMKKFDEQHVMVRWSNDLIDNMDPSKGVIGFLSRSKW